MPIGRSIIHCSAWIVLTALSTKPLPGFAQSATLSLPDAVARVVASNPQLRGREYVLKAAQTRQIRAAQRPALTVNADLEDFAGSGVTQGVDALQTTLRLSGVLELGSKRDARIAAAEQESELVQVDQRAMRLDIFAQVATRFAEVAARQEELAVASEATRLAEVTVERVNERIGIGAAPRYERSKAEVQLARARLDQEHVVHQLNTAKVRLAALWGDTSASFDQVSAALFSLPETKTFEQFVRQLDESPAIQRLLSRQRLAEAQVRLAQAAQRPDVTWSAGVRRLDAFDETAFVASVAVPVGMRNRARPALEEALALQSKAPLDLEAARLEAHTVVYGLYQELAHARLAADTLQRQVRPQTQDVLHLTEQAFRHGRATFIEFAGAQQQLLQVRREAIASATQYHTLLIEIERLVGLSASVGESN